MAGPRQTHPLAIAANALLVEHMHVHLLQYQHILCFHRGIPHHSLTFLLGAAIVALTVAAISAERIAVHIDRLIRTFGARYSDNNNVVTVDLLHEYVFRRENIHTGLVGIVDNIPEFFDESVRIWQIHRMQRLVCPFLYTQQNDPAVRIGKCGVCLPNTLRQPAKSLLSLDAIVFPILLYLGKVNHVFSPPLADFSLPQATFRFSEYIFRVYII